MFRDDDEIYDYDNKFVDDVDNTDDYSDHADAYQRDAYSF